MEALRLLAALDALLRFGVADLRPTRFNRSYFGAAFHGLARGSRERIVPGQNNSWNGATHVCFGSLAEIEACLSDVRFTSKSGHTSASSRCPLCANNYRMHRSKYCHLARTPNGPHLRALAEDTSVAKHHRCGRVIITKHGGNRASR